MMAVFLKEPDIIGGIPRNAGELVLVPDDYDPDNVAQTVRRNVEKFYERERQAKEEDIGGRKQEKRFQEGLQRLKAKLQADYPQFWNKLSNRPALLDTIVDEMRADPDILRRALEDTQWFVDAVTRRFGNGRQ